MKLLMFTISLFNLFSFNQKLNDFEQPFIKEDITLQEKIQQVNGQTDQLYIYQKEQLIYLIDHQKEILLTKGIINATYFDDNYLYLTYQDVSNNYLLRYNMVNGIKEIINIESIIYDIYLDDQKIIGVGEKQNDASIIIFNQNLNIITDLTYGGSGYETFNEITKINQDYFITFTISSISNNSPFLNFDSKALQKGIVKLNQSFEITNILYEYITCFEKFENTLYLGVKKDNKTYLYKVNSDLIVIKELKLLDNYELCNILQNHFDHTFLYLSKVKNEYYLCSDNDQLFKLNDYQIANVNNDLGIIYIFMLDSSHDLQCTKLKHLQIIKSKPLNINLYHLDETSINHFKVGSYFKDLTFTYVDTNIYFDKRIDGVYHATYEEMIGNEVISYEEDIIVDHFTNFIDQGIYKQGKVLEFTGYAKLNGQSIYYGHILQQLGQNFIELEDANQKITKYTIYVVNDYYQTDNNIYLNSYKVEDGQGLKYIYKFNESVTSIDEVVINNHKYYDYKLNNDTLEINFVNKSKERQESYYINYLLVNGQIINIDEQIIVTNLKKSPEIKITKVASLKELKINLQIEDLDKTFMYLDLNHQDKLYKDTNASFNKGLQISFCYNLGDEIVHYKQLLDIYNEAETLIDYKFRYHEGKLNEVDIILNPQSLKGKNTKVELLSNNLLTYLHEEDKLKQIIPFIISGAALIMFIPLQLLVKKIKQKNNDKLDYL